MKKTVSRLAVLGTLALALSACGADPASNDADTDADADETAPQVEGDVDVEDAGILIGGSLCLTGIQAPLDEPIMRGIQLAIDEFNDNGGLLGEEIAFVNLDGASDPVVVGNNGEQLVEMGADAIITPADFDFGGPASRAAQSAGIVGISPGASSPLFGSETLGDKQFTIATWNTTMGAAAAEFGYDQGYEDAYVVTDTFIDYTASLSEYFIESWENLGGNIVAEDTYTQGDQDFSAQLQRLQGVADEVDVIFVSSYMPDLGLIIRDIRAAGIDTPILGGDSYDDPELWSVLGAEYGNDITYATHVFLSEEASPLVPAFLELYEEKHGEEPDTPLVAIGYDTARALLLGMEEAGTTDGDAVAQQMTEIEYELLSGSLQWSSAEDGHEPQKESALVSLEGGETVFNTWVKPEWTPDP
ncbi:MAG TPA: ABC transporter substrate-binding protein [Beutenbergiaceae bacterium]|nr:ABC transporter substrate-binding protein [Beutenbergiaceae bacterium]